MSETFDLIVVGGGPAGSTLASFVAMRNHKVLLLEKEQFPRYQIGESLLPATVYGMCEMLGVSEELENANFPVKLGATLRWGRDETGNFSAWTFAFGESPVLKGTPATAYQVRRAEFDHILLKNARAKGVDVREKHSVKDVIIENDRVVGVRFVDESGLEKEARATFVADASGNTTILASKVGQRQYSEFFRNVALFTYFENGKRLPPPYNGNVITAAFDLGWFWYIPLSHDRSLTSVGAVISSDKADEIKQRGHEAAMNDFIERCPIIKEFLSEAKRITEGMYGQFRLRKDWSYSCDHFWRPGALLVGDAACFVDPVLSTGIHLATYSALLAARSINTCLSEGNTVSEESAFIEFERQYREEYRKAYQFLLGFYDLNKDKESYYWQARSVLDTEEKGNEAFLRIVSGVSTWGTHENFISYSQKVSNVMKENLINSPREVPPVTAKQGTVMTMGALFEKQLDPEKPVTVGEELHRSLYRLHSSGQIKDWKPEKPLFEGGLIPTPDGLGWRNS